MDKRGNCYKNGKGVEKDLEQAVCWYKKAAELGHTIAKAMLEMY